MELTKNSAQGKGALLFGIHIVVGDTLVLLVFIEIFQSAVRYLPILWCKTLNYPVFTCIEDLYIRQAVVLIEDAINVGYFHLAQKQC